MATGGAADFQKFYVKEGVVCWEIFILKGAGPLGWNSKSRGRGAEDFDGFCKNVTEKLLKIK